MVKFFSQSKKKTNTNTNTNSDSNKDAEQLLQKQQISTEKLNSLLEESLSALSCGPSCQKIKTTEDLKQKYLNAQTNLQTAPIQLETTKKNYYVYTEGEPRYNDMLEEELKQKADMMGKMIADNFNEEINNANLMNSYYNTELTNSGYTKELYSVYLEKNQSTQKNIKGHYSDVLTNDRKTYYETEALEDLKYWHYVLWIIYYFFIMPLFIYGLVSKSSYHFLIKLLIGFIVIAYPYYIDFILRTIYGFFHSIWIQLPKNVYNDL
jgi:hypothetical protein